MKLEKLEQRALEIAHKRGVLYDADAYITFQAPQKGPTFAHDPYSMSIPKNPRYAPYIITIDTLLEEHNAANRAEQIELRNTHKSYTLSFTARQFASAFAGIYHPKTMAHFLKPCTAPDDDTAKAVLQRIERIPQDFLCTRYMTDPLRMIISDDAALVKLAQVIPLKYKHPNAKRGIRAPLARDLTHIYFDDEVYARFREHTTRVVYLKGFQNYDQFPESIAHLSADGRPLTLTKLRGYRSHLRPQLPLVFTPKSLWKTIGNEIVLAYSVMDVQAEIQASNHTEIGDTTSQILRTLTGN